MTLRSGETITIPSPVDVHVHLREPGGEDKETIASGTHAAVSGGYQTVFDMPNNPGGNETWSVERLDRKVTIARHNSLTNIGFYAGVDLVDPNLQQISRLATRAAGLKLYMGRTTGNTIEYGLDEARPVIDNWIHHARSAGLLSPILLHAREHIGAETATYIASQEFPVHWCHVSSETEVAMVERLDRQYRYLFSSGVTPHHLLMTSRNADYQQGWNGARMMPPLRQEVDAEKLLHAYRTGIIKILETDHAPHTADNKLAAETANPTQQQPHDDDCYGVSGIEFVLPVMLQRVRLGQLSLERLVDSLYTQPIRMLNQPAARFNGTTQLKIEPHVIGERQLAGKSRNTPYLNWTGGALVQAVTRGGVTYRPSTYRQLRGKASIMQPEGDNI